MSDIDRLPPHSIEAEEAVLGSLLIDPDAIFEVASFLKPDAFYRLQNRWIYEAILSLSEHREPIDFITLTEELRRQNRMEEVGGEAYLIGLINIVPTSENARSYGRVVEAASTRRKLISAASKIANLAYDEAEEIAVVIDRSEQALFGVSEQRTTRDLVPVKQIARDYLDRIEELRERGDDIIGVPTGFNDLDRILGGLNKSDLIIIAARPGMGKCVTADTRIINPQTGELTSIEMMVKQQAGDLLTLDDNYKLRPTCASDFVDNGQKPVYEVITALGRSIKTTLSHPFLTVEGWRPLHELQVGRRIAVPREIPVFGTDDKNHSQAKVLAYMLADGSTRGKSPHFTNKNKHLRKDFIQAALQFPGNKTRTYDSGGTRIPTVFVTQDKTRVSEDRALFPERLKSIMQDQKMSCKTMANDLDVAYATVTQWRDGTNFPSASNFQNICNILDVSETDLVPNGHILAGPQSNSLTYWLKEVGIWGKTATDKFIPKEVYSYSRAKLALFLNRLFACDGSIFVQNGNQAVISYTTISLDLAKDTNHLLLRFGVIAKLRRRQIRYRGKKRDGYQLRITDSQSILTFINEIGAFGKEQNLAQVRDLCISKQANTNTDTIPKEIWKDIAQAKGDRSWASLQRDMGLSSSHNLHVGKRAPGRKRLMQFGVALDSKRLVNLAQSDVYWDSIVSIESLGTQQVYDLCVPETHNFIADDMIVHNTSLLNGFGLTAARRFGKRVAIFNLEMSGEQLVQRMIAAETRIDSQRLRRGQLHDTEWPIFMEAIGRLSETRIFIDDTPALTPMQLRTKCRRLYAEHGLDLIMIDYLQLMQSEHSNNNRVMEISEISRGLKTLARELDVPVVAAAQLSRAVESRQDKRPMLSDLRDSGSIEQDADIVMFIYRDDYYNPETTERPNIAEVNISKHRNGPTATIDLFWHNKLATFRNLQRQEINL